MLKVTIPYPEGKKAKANFLRTYSLNSYYSGKCWGQRKREMDAWHMMVVAAMKRAGIRRACIQRPVAVTFRWDDGLDIDNHAVLAKGAVDVLKGYVIQDDSPRYFREVLHKFWDGGCISMEIEEAADREEKRGH